VTRDFVGEYGLKKECKSSKGTNSKWCSPRLHLFD